MSGQKIIDGLKQAVAGDFARVTIEGQTWVRADADRDRALIEECARCVPTNWCDALLTGPEAPRAPLDCPAVERLLLGIIGRIRALAR